MKVNRKQRTIQKFYTLSIQMWPNIYYYCMYCVQSKKYPVHVHVQMKYMYLYKWKYVHMAHNNLVIMILISSRSMAQMHYLVSSVSSVPWPTLINTSSMVVTDTPKLLIPSDCCLAGKEESKYKYHNITVCEASLCSHVMYHLLIAQTVEETGDWKKMEGQMLSLLPHPWPFCCPVQSLSPDW